MVKRTQETTNKMLTFVLYRENVMPRDSGKKEWIALIGKDNKRLPIIIRSKDQSTTLWRHIIKRRPASKLRIGKRYLCPMTKQRAKLLAKRFVSENWNKLKTMKKVYKTKRKAVFVLYKNYYGNGTAWDIRKWKGVKPSQTL